MAIPVASNIRAFQSEVSAFKDMRTKTKGIATAFKTPSGADKGFPDFGFAFKMPDGKKIDLHIEYKDNHTAHMGSMRDWKFDGIKFYTNDRESEQKTELITLMNSSTVAVSNAKRLLVDLKTHFNPSVKELSSSSLNVVKDKTARKAYADNFAKHTKNFTIANISNNLLGDKIIQHYKTKFSKSLRTRTNASVLGMMINRQFWLLDSSGQISEDDIEFIGDALGASGKIKVMKNLTAKLEVRVQPNGLNSPANNPKPAFLDTMASYRLQSKPGGGILIL